METLSRISERSSNPVSHENRKKILFVNWFQVLSASNGGLSGSLAGTSRRHFKKRSLILTRPQSKFYSSLCYPLSEKKKTNSIVRVHVSLCVSACFSPFSQSLPLLVPF